MTPLDFVSLSLFDIVPTAVLTLTVHFLEKNAGSAPVSNLPFSKKHGQIHSKNDGTELTSPLLPCVFSLFPRRVGQSLGEKPRSFTLDDNINFNQP